VNQNCWAEVSANRVPAAATAYSVARMSEAKCGIRVARKSARVSLRSSGLRGDGHFALAWSASDTRCQVLSGLNAVMLPAMAAVFRPRSFS
jgi:hypothetical protein